MMPSTAGARETLSLRAQILAAQRAVRDIQEREERLAKPRARRAPASDQPTLTGEIVRVLVAAAQPLLAPEIRARLPGFRGKSVASSLIRLMQSGAIRRHGLEGKYRYTSN